MERKERPAAPISACLLGAPCRYDGVTGALLVANGIAVTGESRVDELVK